MTNLQATVLPASAAESILESMTGPLLVLNASLRVTMANPAFCRFAGISATVMNGMPIDDVMVDGPRLRTMLETIADDSAEAGTVEIECATSRNSWRIVSVSARRLRANRSDPILLLLELRDITQERVIERRNEKINQAIRKHGAELEQMNRELDAFTHSIAHDVRTPLRLTSRIAHTLLKDHGDAMPSAARELVKIILNGTDEMSILAGNLLRFAQLNREPIKRKRVSVQNLVRETVAELSGTWNGRDVKFVIDDLAPCYGNRAMLKQLMLNLLENALKYTTECEHAEIHVGCTPSGNGSVYFVHDNGIGFDASEAESMFLVFRRLHRMKNIEGSGVGLAIAKRIVERHGGRIWAQGEPDIGATLYFTLDKPAAEKPQTVEKG